MHDVHRAIEASHTAFNGILKNQSSRTWNAARAILVGGCGWVECGEVPDGRIDWFNQFEGVKGVFG